MNIAKLFVGILASLLVVSFASASGFITSTILSQPTTITHNAGSFQVTFNATNNGVVGNASFSHTLAGITFSSVTFSPSSVTQLAQDASQVVTATFNYAANQAGTITGNMVITPTGANFGSVVSLPIAAITVNASSSFTTAKTAEITPSQNGTFTITNTGNQALTFALNATGALNVTLSSSSVSVSPGQTSSAITVSPLASSSSIGTTSATVTVSASGVATQTLTFSRTGSFCVAGKKTTNLTITAVEISTDGEDDDKWKPLDTVTLEVEVENTAPHDIDDVVVEFGLFDKNGKNVVKDLDFFNEDEEEFDLGDLDDGDDAKATFEFKIPADLDTGDYTVVFKAYSDDVSQSSMCTDSFADSKTETVKIEQEDDEGKFIAFDDITLSPSRGTCGETVTLTFDAVNIGDNDEDKVKILLVNRLLGIDQYVELTQGLDEGDSKLVSFDFVVPQVADGKYTLALDAEYDYKNGVYRESLDDAHEVDFSVFGCTVNQQTGSGFVNIDADLVSEAKEGKEFKVTASIKNNGAETALFAVTATGVEGWATVKDISENIVQIPAGQSKEVTITLLADDDAAGEQSFTLNVRTGNGQVQSRQVILSVDEGSLFGGSGLATALIAVNVILVLLIIVVAVIVSRR